MNRKNILFMLIIEFGIIFGVILTYIILNSNIPFPECYIYSHLGILCPSCGDTRLVIYLFAGNIKNAFLIHPVFFITLVYLFIFNIVFIINSFKKNKICKWMYPTLVHLWIFVIALILFTILRNVV